MSADSESFKEKLDIQYQWPSLYTFKFIAPLHMVDSVKTLFIGHTIKEKPSRKGNYLSLTISLMAGSSKQVIDYYVKVHELGGGVISL